MLNIVNRPINAWTVRALQLIGTEVVLDVGFGGGVGLELVRARLTSGRVVGVDISAEMVHAAARRFDGDRVGVLRADVAALPFEDASFDRAYSVNSVFFWPDAEAGLREIKRVLRPGGLAVVAGPTSAFLLARVAGLAPPSAPGGPGDVRRIAGAVGFREVRHHRVLGAVLIVARR